MTTPTERVAEVVDRVLSDLSFDKTRRKVRRHDLPEGWQAGVAEALADAGLLAAPVDGELRKALARALQIPVHDIVCHRDCGDDISTYPPTPPEFLDPLLPVIAAHVAEERRKLREEIEVEIMRDGFDPGRYTLTHPVGSNTLRVMQLVRDDCAQIARGDA